MAFRTALVGLVVSGLVACGSSTPASRGGFLSPNPAARLYAITQAGQARDRSAIGHLVEQLDSDDPVIRMMAIHALEHITGTRMGYNPYASTVDRQPAIEAWVQAVRQGRFNQAALTKTRPEDQTR